MSDFGATLPVDRRQLDATMHRITMHNEAKTEFSKEMLKGVLDVLVLHVIAKNPMHGYLVTKSIATMTEGHLEIQDGTLYPILHRLEKRNLIAGEWVESEQSRRRRQYRITPDGQTALSEQAGQWRILISVLAHVTSEAP